jgi:predicted amidohydrolase
MTQPINLVAIQLVSTPNIDDNFTQIIQQLEFASLDWDMALPALVVLPECFAYFGGRDSSALTLLDQQVQTQLVDRLASLAKNYKIWLIAGSIPTPSPNPKKMHATALCFDPQGHIVGTYHKTHLFDVDIKDATGSYRESDSTVAGTQPLVIETDFGRIGVCICYDLRFSTLFNAMVKDNPIDYLVVPAAFTKETGQAHWHHLLAARAIEYQCYVIAANQGGTHNNGMMRLEQHLMCNSTVNFFRRTCDFISPS